jgi:type IV secretory pathway VirB2 component (pilin)
MNKISNIILGNSVERLYRILLVAFALFGAMGTMAAATSNTVSGTAPANSVICSLGGLFSTIKTAIFVIGLILMILGGALYAGSHVMPGSSKGTVQGYAMGMILGGVIGVVIALLAPYILSLISGGQSSSYTSASNIAAYC